jgi:hypothetical protein
LTLNAYFVLLKCHESGDEVGNERNEEARGAKVERKQKIKSVEKKKSRAPLFSRLPQNSARLCFFLFLVCCEH